MMLKASLRRTWDKGVVKLVITGVVKLVITPLSRLLDS
jgi:hypothetical protein